MSSIRFTLKFSSKNNILFSNQKKIKSKCSKITNLKFKTCYGKLFKNKIVICVGTFIQDFAKFHDAMLSKVTFQ